MRTAIFVSCAACLLPPASPAAAPPVLGLRPGPGLIGRMIVGGEDAGIVFRYEHGRVFRHELVERKFAERFDAKVPRRGAGIDLLGRLHVPGNGKVKVRVRFAGGSVSHGVQTLYLGGRVLGSVGDDMGKSQVHDLTLAAGTHRVRWVLTGGRFGNNLLRFEDAATGMPLTLSYSAEDLKWIEGFPARDVGVADSEERGWPIPTGW